jgi:ankyrin repeat protein
MVDFNARGHHHGTPLILACRGGHLEIINLLLAKDSININLVDREMASVLRDAASRGDVDVIKLLLNRPDIDVDSNFIETLMEEARFPDVMKLILDHDVNKSGSFGIALIKTLARFRYVESACAKHTKIPKKAMRERR